MNLAAKYSRESYLEFLRDFLPDFTKDLRDISHKTSNFDSIKSLGTSNILDLHLLEIEVRGDLNRRVSITNEGFKTLKHIGAFKALVIFHSKDSDDWRLSLMTAQPTIKEGKIVTKLSNPRRYSYLLGPEAKVNTPKRFLLNKKIETFEDLLSTFSIEVVNKEFYQEIARVFYKLIGGQVRISSRAEVYKRLLALPGNPGEKIYQEFAVRLIGRIIFSWFLKQKKSSSGVPLLVDELLSSDSVSKNNGYYHLVLEKIFFEALNKEQESREPTLKVDERFRLVPFLNGGLFDPHEEDYYENGVFNGGLTIPDSWFEDFFKILETYNFTIDENTINDVDLSVDPEMLGRIFENLLAEVNPETGESARKVTGSYYTPRVIVEYMVDQSLTEYLKTRTKISVEKILALVSSDELDDESYPLSSNEKDEIIQALNTIKIIDPACGSGAFPIGILQKIILMLQRIDSDAKLWFLRKTETLDPLLKDVFEKRFKNENFDYIRKSGVIKDSIYGVDIQPIAVEVSKLRCFLTLIVDEEINDEEPNRGVVPLPNLEFKFVAANTLLNLPGKKVQENFQSNLFEEHSDIDKLKSLRDEYFITNGKNKEIIKYKFKDIQREMFKKQISKAGQGEMTMALADWDPFSSKASNWFDPDWMFGFKTFDVAIANPPYVRQELFTPIKEALKERYGNFFNGRADLYTYFYKIGIELLSENGVLSYISSNKFFVRGYGLNTRRLLAKENTLLTVINFGELPVFKAAVDSSILIALKKRPEPGTSVTSLQVKTANEIQYIVEAIKDNSNQVSLEGLGEKEWVLDSPEKIKLLEKIRKDKKLLWEYANEKIFAGIKTGYDEAFVINGDKANELISHEAQSKELIKPWFRGKDIKRWYSLNQDFNIIYIPLNNLSIESFPAIRSHLLSYRIRLEKRATSQKWFEMQQPQERFTKLFDKPKIIYPDCAKEMRACFDETGAYGTMAMYFVPYDSLIMAILNSKLFDWYARMTFATFGDPWNEGRIIFKTIYMKEVPIPKVSEKEKTLIDNLVNEAIKISKAQIDQKEKAARIKIIETQLDDLVFSIYQLNQEDVAVIASSYKS